MVLKAALFDLDGTLIDSEWARFQAWRRVFAVHDHELSEAEWHRDVWGLDAVRSPFEHLCFVTGRAIAEDAFEAQRLEHELSLLRQRPFLPGVETVVRECKRLGLLVGLVTSSGSSWAERHVASSPLGECFDILVTRESVSRQKPDAEPYLKALSLLGVKNEEAIAFEDSPIGILAATRAEIRCIACKNRMTDKLDLSQAYLVLETLEGFELEKRLGALALPTRPL
jgi:HAD superfamily hydrolase (TIGR01509 family)